MAFLQVAHSKHLWFKMFYWRWQQCNKWLVCMYCEVVHHEGVFIVLLALFQSFTDDDGQDDLWPLSDFVRSKELSKFINSRRIPLLRSKQESTEQRLMTAYYSSLFCKIYRRWSCAATSKHNFNLFLSKSTKFTPYFCFLAQSNDGKTHGRVIWLKYKGSVPNVLVKSGLFLPFLSCMMEHWC